MDAGTRTAVVSGVANAALSLGKIVAGTLTGSHALVADGVHSAADVVSSVLSAVAREYGRHPPDESHPFGHENAETAAALAIGLLIAATGIGIVWDAVNVLAAGAYRTPAWGAAATAAVVVLVKAGLWWITRRQARILRSPSLGALALDHRADALLSMGIVAGLGLATWGVPVLDPILGLGVGFVVVATAYAPVRRSFGILMDEAPEGAAEEAAGLAAAVGGVCGVEGVRVHPVGPGLVVHVVVRADPMLTLREADAIADAVQCAVREGMADVAEVLARVTSENSGPQASRSA